MINVESTHVYEDDWEELDDIEIKKFIGLIFLFTVKKSRQRKRFAVMEQIRQMTFFSHQQTYEPSVFSKMLHLDYASARITRSNDKIRTY